MDNASAQHPQGEATPIFGAYRRGYDPDQVDRYVAEQQRRLDEALRRASDAERKLAAAVGQLRELHRRVAVLESEERSPQPAPLDTLGERVQRILQEAWEGAYALRQAAEQEMAELRERTAGEAEAIVVGARQRAASIDEEIERRRTAYLAQVEEDRARALAQITHLHNQRDAALGELLKVKAVIESTVADVARPRGATTGGSPDPADAALDLWSGADQTRAAHEQSLAENARPSSSRPQIRTPSAAPSLRTGSAASIGRRLVEPVDARGAALGDVPDVASDPSELVRKHRTSRPRSVPEDSLEIAPSEGLAVFDFEDERQTEV
jgi:cell division septum initiation protein DivIVA